MEDAQITTRDAIVMIIGGISATIAKSEMEIVDRYIFLRYLWSLG
jgi:hypothetical protein